MGIIFNRNLIYNGILDKENRNKRKKKQETKRRKRQKLLKINVDQATEEMLKIFE